MTLSSEKYLTAIVVIIAYIEEVGALIATLFKFAWSNFSKKNWYKLFLQGATRCYGCHCDYHYSLRERRRRSLGPGSPTLPAAVYA